MLQENEKQIINSSYSKMPGSYLFSEIAKRINEYRKNNPGKDIIKLGIGDVTRPVTPCVTKALHEAVEEMSGENSFHGYGPENGYSFLRDKISEKDYMERGIEIGADEIFVSDGSKCDCANIIEIFADTTKIAVCDPVYPVYVDSNAMANRAGDYDSEKSRWSEVFYMPCLSENDFIPEIPEKSGKDAPDLIYLCSPNNPTGAVMSYDELVKWVDYANGNNSVILFDGAYESFITGDYPRSIYEIPGAKKCAIEFRSFSKTAGFTGLRCAYTVIPKDLSRNGASLNEMWTRRQSTCFNGVSYIIQKAALAVYSEEGKKQTLDNISYYMTNAKVIKEGLEKAGFDVYGGTDAPYIWLKTPGGMSSWDFFSDLLEKTGVAGTPGAGFGPCGEGYFRLSAFGESENTKKAISRIIDAYSS